MKLFCILVFLVCAGCSSLTPNPDIIGTYMRRPDVPSGDGTTMYPAWENDKGCFVLFNSVMEYHHFEYPSYVLRTNGGSPIGIYEGVSSTVAVAYAYVYSNAIVVVTNPVITNGQKVSFWIF